MVSARAVSGLAGAAAEAGEAGGWGVPEVVETVSGEPGGASIGCGSGRRSGVETTLVGAGFGNVPAALCSSNGVRKPFVVFVQTSEPRQVGSGPLVEGHLSVVVPVLGARKCPEARASRGDA